MSEKLKYFQTLGIPPTTDHKEIKRAYRRKAMEFHPDKNPSDNAQVQFIEITEAYEILIGLKREVSQNIRTQSTKEARAEKIKQAKRRYQKIKETEEEKDALYYAQITSGWKWKSFRIFAIYSLILSLLLSTDYFATRKVKAIPEIKQYSLLAYTVQFNSERFQIHEPSFWHGEFPPVQINYSFFFNDIKSVSIINEPHGRDKTTLPSDRTNRYRLFTTYSSKEFYSYASTYYLFPILHIGLFIPFVLLGYKRPNITFSIGRIVSLWVIFPTVVYLTFSNGRIFHLLGLL